MLKTDKAIAQAMILSGGILLITFLIEFFKSEKARSDSKWSAQEKGLQIFFDIENRKILIPRRLGRLDRERGRQDIDSR